MPEVMLIDVKMFAEQAIYEKAMELILPQRREIIARLKNPMAAARSLGAGVLLSIALSQYGISEKAIETETLPHGKPYIPGDSFHFNLSHSGDYALCVYDDAPVGCDVQILKQTLPKGLERILSPEERAFFFEFDENRRITTFFRIWSRKESLLKQEGSGLQISLSDISVIKNGIFMDELLFHGKHIFFREYQELMPEYAVCVCGESRKFPAKINEITAEILTKY